MQKNEYIKLEFGYANAYTNYLEQAFSNLPKPVEEYTWYVVCSENNFFCENGDSISSTSKQHGFLPEGKYSGEAFKKLSQTEHFVSLLTLYAVTQDCDFDFDTVNTYRDFLESPADFAFIVCEGMMECYAKDTSVLQAVADACIQCGPPLYEKSQGPLTWITEGNDGRTRMKVW